MSFEHVAIAMNHSRATGSAKLVLVGIASHANQDGDAFPSMATLARYAGMSGWDAVPEDDSKEARAKARAKRESARRAVQRAICQLEELGELSRDVNAGGTRKVPEHMKPNLYTVTLVCPPECDHTPQHGKRPDVAAAILAGVRETAPEPVDNSPADPAVEQSPRGCTTASPAVDQPHEPSMNQLPNNDLPETPGVDASAREVPGPDEDPPWSPEQNAAAELWPCPSGFGEGRNLRHWCPPTLDGCCKCGQKSADILAAVRHDD